MAPLGNSEQNSRSDHSPNLIIVLVSALLMIVSFFIVLMYGGGFQIITVSIIAVFLLFVCFSGIQHYLSYPGVFVLLAVFTVRYLILPIMMTLTNGWDEKTILEGNLLYLYEEVAVLVTTAYILSTKYKDKRQFSIINRLQDQNTVLFVLLILVSLVMIVIWPSLLGNYHFTFISAENYQEVEGDGSVRGFSLIIKWAKLMLPVVLSMWIVKSRIPKNVQFALCFALLVGFNILFFTGSSRNSAILPTVAGIFTLVLLFPEQKKRTILVSSVVLAVGIVTLTILKATLHNSSLETTKEYTSYLSNYFSGPSNMAVSVQTYRNYGIASFSTRINDLFGNMPLLSSRLDLTNRTAAFFNITYYGYSWSQDKIIPMAGQGLMHFGYIFSVLPSILSVVAMSYFDHKARNSLTLPGAFICSYAAVRCAISGMSNMSILLSSFYQIIVPLLVLEFISRKITLAENRIGNTPKKEGDST